MSTHHTCIYNCGGSDCDAPPQLRPAKIPPDGHPLRRLGILLADLLDEDQFAHAEFLMVGAFSQHERSCFVLMEMMQAYERRVRSDCKSDAEIAARPWECAEYVKAAEWLRKALPPAAEPPT